MTFEDYQTYFRTEPGVINVESDEHLTLPGIHPYLGVRTTSVSEFAAVADKIRQCLPDVRIIMVIRNQASLIVSRYSEYLITGGSLEFDEFASRLMYDEDGVNRHYQNYYHEIIRILEQRFPPDSLLVMLQEGMRREPAATDDALARILRIRELEPIRGGLRSERRSLSEVGMRILRGLNRLVVAHSSIGGEPPTTRVPLCIYRNLVKLVRALDFYALSKFSADASRILSESHRAEILNHFRDDNLKLQSRFGRDLKALGYFA